MIEDFKRLDGRRVRLRPLVATVALLVSAAPLVAWATASDEASEAQAASAQPVRQVVAAPASAKSAERSLAAKGLVRVGMLRLGTRGKLVAEPKGSVPGAATNHWYKVGTHVTVRAKDTRTARFSGWTGACQGKRRVCTFVVKKKNPNVFAGFSLDKQGAKGLKKGDPRLKVVVSD
jgi:Divergent InlB B-repeat domain